MGPFPARTRIGAACPRKVARLVRLCREILHTQAEAAAGHEKARQRLGDALLRASLHVVQSMALGATGSARGRPALSRTLIIERALELIDARLGENIRLGDLCEATGVSVRTLSSVFQAQLDMSPHQYIMMRRLHGVHAAIRDAGPADTVSDICARFGIWDFGRFARAYRTQFGVVPSRMLAYRQQRLSVPSDACVEAQCS